MPFIVQLSYGELQDYTTHHSLIKAQSLQWKDAEKMTCFPLQWKEAGTTSAADALCLHISSLARLFSQEREGTDLHSASWHSGEHRSFYQGLKEIYRQKFR